MNETWLQPTERPLTESEKVIRDLFVTNYLIDYDPVKAAIRCGYEVEFATVFAERFMCESYTLRLILERERAAKTEAEEKRVSRSDIELVMGTLRDVAVNGTYSARVRAANMLSLIYGLEDSKKIQTRAASGVMVVPGIASVEDWEKEAMVAQQQLMDNGGF